MFGRPEKDIETRIPVALSSGRANGPSPKGEGRGATRVEIRLRPPSSDSTKNRLAIATAALERIRLAAEFESFPIIERTAAEALDAIKKESSDAK